MLYLCINKNDKDMKYVTTYTFVKKVPRSYDKSNKFAKVIVEEYKTVYSVSVQIIGYACPSVLDFRVSKKKTTNPYVAALGVVMGAYSNGNI